MKFQSTLPRGSDQKEGYVIVGMVISIHAPSRERPSPQLAMRTAHDISIHAPSRERQD